MLPWGRNGSKVWMLAKDRLHLRIGKLFSLSCPELGGWCWVGTSRSRVLGLAEGPLSLMQWYSGEALD